VESGTWATEEISGVDLSQNKGVRSVRSSHIRLFQAPRKISFTFHFWHKSFIFHPSWCETCRVIQQIQQQFWMNKCDILGGQNIFWPPTYSHGGQDPKPHPHDLCPWKKSLDFAGNLYYVMVGFGSTGYGYVQRGPRHPATLGICYPAFV